MKQQHAIGPGWIAGVFAVLAILLSGFALTSAVWYDDAGHWIVLRSWFTEGALCYPHDPLMGKCTPHDPFITLGPAVYYPTIAWTFLTGYDMPIVRFLMVVFGLLTSLAWFHAAQTFRKADTTLVAVLLSCFGIQYLTYGSQMLGEVPMLGFLFLMLVQIGGIFQVNQLWARAMLAGLSAGLAILSKEYALGLAGWWLAGALGWAWFAKNKHAAGAVILSGVIALVVWGIWNVFSFGGFGPWLHGILAKSSYSGEFWVFGWEESLPFLEKKPVIWLGAFAMLLRIRTRRAPADLFLAWCWIGQLAFFLASAGYDRFGFQLLFIPSLFLAEFVQFGWRFSQNTSSPLFWRILLVLAVFAISSQRAVPELVVRWNHPDRINAAEKQVNAFLLRSDFKAVFTYDQQLIPFLDPSIGFRLAANVPSAAQDEPILMLREQEVFVSGPYAETEYQQNIHWNTLETIFTTPDGTYTVYRQVEGNFFAGGTYRFGQRHP